MIASWRSTPFGVVVALSGRQPILVELLGEDARRWIERVNNGELHDAIAEQLLPSKLKS
ncbi:MAG: hypothetical protein ACI8TP_000765 [Acidimicrobiales bacterium]|jgi:hypothetical protein